MCGSSGKVTFTADLTLLYMGIAYSLIDNNLTPDPSDLRAQVQIAATATIEDIASDVVRPGSTVTKAEFLAMYEEFKMAAIRRAQRGERAARER
jgi:hypothetical protein